MPFAQMSDGGILAAAAGLLVAFGGLVVWLVKGWISGAEKREAALTERVVALEKYNREELHSLANSCRLALEKNTLVVAELIGSIKSLPCPYFRATKEGTTQP